MIGRSGTRLLAAVAAAGALASIVAAPASAIPANVGKFSWGIDPNVVETWQSQPGDQTLVYTKWGGEPTTLESRAWVRSVDINYDSPTPGSLRVARLQPDGSGYRVVFGNDWRPLPAQPPESPPVTVPIRLTAWPGELVAIQVRGVRTQRMWTPADLVPAGTSWFFSPTTPGDRAQLDGPFDEDTLIAGQINVDMYPQPTSDPSFVADGGSAPRVGLALTITRASWVQVDADTTYTWQWWRCPAQSLGLPCFTIAGATSASYTPTAEDVGSRLYASHVATNGETSYFASAPRTAVVELPEGKRQGGGETTGGDGKDPGPGLKLDTRVKTTVGKGSATNGGFPWFTVHCMLNMAVLRKCDADAYAAVKRNEGKKARGASLARRSAAASRVLVATGKRTRAKPGHRRAAVTLHLTAAGKRLLERRGKLDITVEVTARAFDADQAVRSTVKATLARTMFTTPSGAFAANSGTPTAAARAFLRRVAPALKTAKRITCTGHTSTAGPTRAKRAGNRKLGLSRARAVCAQLRKLGVKAKLVARSNGSDTPIASNRTAAGRSANRRVVIKITR